MIVLDATEVRSTSRMPTIPDARVSKVLEATTGADIMVTLAEFSVSTAALVRRHVAKGAILIQRKSGQDFIHSITDEGINVALARMHECGAMHTHQRIIMSTGCFAETNDGMTTVGTFDEYAGKVLIRWLRAEPPVHYKALRTIIRRIGMRGGYYLPLASDNEIPDELAHVENDLRYLSGKPVKGLLLQDTFPPDPPKEDDPLQLPVAVTDGRRILAAFHNVGVVRATALWNGIVEWLKEQRPASLGFTEADWIPGTVTLLWWASAWDVGQYELPHIKGWGKGMRRSVREELGLANGMDLRVVDASVGDVE